MSRTELQSFEAACNYPGRLDEAAVEASLREYLSALGVKREIVRLKAGWELHEHPSLERYVNRVLDDWVKRNPSRASARAALDARDARAARDALDALDARDALRSGAMRRFAAWCVQAWSGWWWWRFEMSFIATTYLGARQLNKPAVVRWSKPVFEAFLAGAWLLHWTDDTLYWAAKPTVHKDPTPGTRRLHNEHYAAVESDVENLYFWKGVMVPGFVVTRPEWITVKHIDTEENAEVRRVMIERMGQERYLMEGGAKEIHRDDFGILYRKEIPNDEPLVMVKVVNSTPEPDGSSKDYFLRVPPNCRKACEAVAWTFGESTSSYAPLVQT